jgi:hypothetical protein
MLIGASVAQEKLRAFVDFDIAINKAVSGSVNQQ